MSSGGFLIAALIYRHQSDVEWTGLWKNPHPGDILCLRRVIECVNKTPERGRFIGLAV